MIILAANKESCTVILNKSDYIKKVNNIIKKEYSKVHRRYRYYPQQLEAFPRFSLQAF